MLIFHLKERGKKKIQNHTLSPSSNSGGGKGLSSRGRGGGGINGLLSHPSSYLNPSPLSKPPFPLPPTMNLYFFSWQQFPMKWASEMTGNFFYVFISFLTSSDFKFEWVSRTNKCLLTCSILSGSDADASHLLFIMKMFGLERRWFTSWKKCFSCKWQGYQMRNYPTSMARFNLSMQPHWINFSCNKLHFKATEILKIFNQI